ncbi:MAG: fumarylacetoacetate hydrolase family protein [Planctomycetes bacterium]|nr:fumarylacetoacetate hydrolase family protein [Planctomycetota bacterium]
MRIAQFKNKAGETRYGIVEGPTIAVADGDPIRGLKRTGASVPLADVQLLAPVDPVNVLCIGQNYKAHVEEGGAKLPKAPILFMKSTTAVIGPEQPVVIPKIAPAEVDYEAELALVIGKSARHVPESEALKYVLGYTCAHDVSARDCQRGDGQWCRAKSFETFCPIGPWLETDLQPLDVRVQGRLNGQTMQDASTSLMIFSIPFLISYLSRGMTLLPGTLLLTGTPAGVGFARTPPVFLKPGDVFEVEVEGVGVLRNPLVAEE